MINFPYSNILVLGLAKSGTAAAKALLKLGKKIRINDKNMEENHRTVKELAVLGAEIIVGSHPLHVLDDIDIVVKNPGINYENPIIVEAINRGIPVITEIEIAYYLTDGEIIGITGSNGKTTTTTLITKMLEASQLPVKVAGNIGIVATEIAEELKKEETLVLELSSFQLQGTIDFKPHTAVLLNIFEAHLDYHKSFDNYKKAKCNIFKNQSEEDFLIYNADEPLLAEEIHHANATLIPFSIRDEIVNGVYVKNGAIYFKDEKIIDRRDIVLVGEHNLQNILAAIAAAKLNGASNKGINHVLRTFSGVKHRLQYVESLNGRLFYNDSKATNILATQKALTSFQQPTILLAGGLDRGNGFDELGAYLENVKAMILFGETKEKLKELGEKKQIPIIELVEDVEEAVNKAYAVSDPGDVVLLSPACASWDQYRTFEERGDMFIQAVHKLM